MSRSPSARLNSTRFLIECGALPLRGLPLLGRDVAEPRQARPVGLDELAPERVRERLLGRVGLARLVRRADVAPPWIAWRPSLIGSARTLHAGNDTRAVHTAKSARTTRGGRVRGRGRRRAVSDGRGGRRARRAHPPARAALEPALVLLGPGQPQPERGRAGALVAHPDVVDLLAPLHLAPAVGEQVLVASRRVLAQLVRVRHLQVQALDANFLVVGHEAGRGSRRSRSAAEPADERSRPGT